MFRELGPQKWGNCSSHMLPTQTMDCYKGNSLKSPYSFVLFLIDSPPKKMGGIWWPLVNGCPSQMVDFFLLRDCVGETLDTENSRKCICFRHPKVVSDLFRCFCRPNKKRDRPRNKVTAQTVSKLSSKRAKCKAKLRSSVPKPLERARWRARWELWRVTGGERNGGEPWWTVKHAEMSWEVIVKVWKQITTYK